MVGVVIVVDAEVNGQGMLVAASPELVAQVGAMQRAIAHAPILEGLPAQSGLRDSSEVQLMAAKSLHNGQAADETIRRAIVCPLTLNLAGGFQFEQRPIYDACGDRDAMRLQAKTIGTRVGDGSVWLPIVWTSKGPLYGEVIGQTAASHARADGTSIYQQPIHLGDRWRQPLYSLGQRLLSRLLAPPAVYLLQFGVDDDQICFDRLFPFPAAPALASLGVQVPDLFTCHWRCLTGQPVLDMVISGTQPFQPLSALSAIASKGEKPAIGTI